MEWLKKSKIYQMFLEEKKINVIEWAVLFALIVFAILTFHYYDIACTVDNSILLLRSIRDGEFFHYYDYCIGKTQTMWAPNYEILMYIIFAIWNIPVAILHHFWKFDYLYSMPAILWEKFFLLLCVFIVAHYIYKICMLREDNKEKGRLAQFLFLSSLNCIVPALMISQYDIISLVFIIMGLYAFLQHKTWRFIFCFSIAIPLKIFGLFIFVPLVLMDEKKIMRAIGKMACGLSVLAVCKLIASPSASYHYLVGSFSSVILDKMIGDSIKIGLNSVAIFIAVVVAVCIYAYAKDFKDERERYAIYIPFILFTALFTTFSFYPYWIILLVPFTILNIMENENHLKLNILLDSLSGVCVFLISTLVYPWIYGNEAMKDLLVSKMPVYVRGGMRYSTVNDFLTRYGVNEYLSVIYTIFWICLLALVVLNSPKLSQKSPKGIYRVEHTVVGVRLAAIIVVIALWLVPGIIKPYETVYDMTMYASSSSNINILSEGSFVSQKFDVEKTGTIREIDLRFNNQASTIMSVSAVDVILRDVETNEIIYEDEIGTSLIGDKLYYLKTKAAVEKGKTYEVVLKGKNGNGLAIYPALTESMYDSRYPVNANGQELEQNLYMKVIVK